LYEEKLRRDLARGLRLFQPETEPVPSEDGFFVYFSHVYREMHALFPRRRFQLFALDEYNTFRPMCCFVKPMTQPETPEMVSPLSGFTISLRL
jgi:hypothetical protein